MASQIDNSQVFKIKGIQTDNEPTLQDSTYAFNLKNMCITRVGDLFSLTNIEGTKQYPIYNYKSKNIYKPHTIKPGIIPTYTLYNKFKSNEYVCGAITINNENIILVTSVKRNNEEIYDSYFYRLKQHPKVNGYYLSSNTYDSEKQQQVESYDKPFYIWKDSNISPEHPLHIVNSYENNLLSKLYWIDGVNPLRSLDLESNNIQEQTSSTSAFEGNLYNDEHFIIYYNGPSAKVRQFSARKWLLYYYTPFGSTSSLICESKWFDPRVNTNLSDLNDKDLSSYQIIVNNLNTKFNQYIIVRMDRFDNGTITYTEVQRGQIDKKTSISIIDNNDTIEEQTMYYSPSNIYNEFNTVSTIISNAIAVKDSRILLGNNTIYKPNKLSIDDLHLKCSVEETYGKEICLGRIGTIGVSRGDNNRHNFYDDSTRHFKCDNTYKLGYYLINSNGLASKVQILGNYMCTQRPRIVQSNTDSSNLNNIQEVWYELPTFKLVFDKESYKKLKEANIKFVVPVYEKPTYSTRKVIAQGLWMPTDFQYYGTFRGRDTYYVHYMFPYIKSLYHMGNSMSANNFISHVRSWANNLPTYTLTRGCYDIPNSKKSTQNFEINTYKPIQYAGLNNIIVGGKPLFFKFMDCESLEVISTILDGKQDVKVLYNQQTSKQRFPNPQNIARNICNSGSPLTKGQKDSFMSEVKFGHTVPTCNSLCQVSQTRLKDDTKLSLVSDYPTALYRSKYREDEPYNGISNTGSYLSPNDFNSRFHDHTMGIVLSPDIIYDNEINQDTYLYEQIALQKSNQFDLHFAGILPGLGRTINDKLNLRSAYPFYMVNEKDNGSDNISTPFPILNSDFLQTNIIMYYKNSQDFYHDHVYVGYSKINSYGNNSSIIRDKYQFFNSGNLPTTWEVTQSMYWKTKYGKLDEKLCRVVKKGYEEIRNGITLNYQPYNNILTVNGPNIIKPGNTNRNWIYRSGGYKYVSDDNNTIIHDPESIYALNVLDAPIAPFDSGSWISGDNSNFLKPKNLFGGFPGNKYKFKRFIFNPNSSGWKDLYSEDVESMQIDIDIPDGKNHYTTTGVTSNGKTRIINKDYVQFDTLPFSAEGFYKWGITPNFKIQIINKEIETYNRKGNSKYSVPIINNDDYTYDIDNTSGAKTFSNEGTVSSAILIDKIKDECGNYETIDIVDIEHNSNNYKPIKNSLTQLVKGNEMTWADQGCNIDNPNNIIQDEELHITYTLGDTYFGIVKSMYSIEKNNIWNYGCAVYFPCESYYNINHPYVDHLTFDNPDALNSVVQANYGAGLTNLHRCGTGFDIVDPSLYNYQYELNVSEYPTQILVSEPKTNIGTSSEQQLIDPWFNFKIDPYFLDSKYGPIWALQTTEKYLYAFQETGISRVLFNQLGSISSDPNVPAYLSATGQFQGHQYVIKEGGCKDQHSTVSNSNGIYCYDNNTKSLIFVSDDKIANLTINKKCRLLFQHEFSDADDRVSYLTTNAGGIKLLYDSKDQRVLVQNREHSIIYSEVSGEFETLSDYKSLFHICNINDTKRYFTFGGYTGEESLYEDKKFSFINDANNLQILNTDAVNQQYVITLIANSKTGKEKIFNTLSYRSEVGFEPINNVLNNTAFNTLINNDLKNQIIVYNNVQTHPIFENITTNTTYQQAKEEIKYNLYTPSNIKAKYRTWSLQLPRGDNHLYNRLRDHYVQIQLDVTLDSLLAKEFKYSRTDKGNVINKFRIHDLKVI